MFEEIFAKLNTEQAEAVKCTEGFVQVIAGAGSGKTRTLTQRYLYLTTALGVSTRNILCLTFTNKAAAEMRRRVREAVRDRDTGYITTFHSFCASFLRDEISTLCYPSSYMIMDNDDKESILAEIFRDMNITSREMTIREASDYIADKKSVSAYVPIMTDIDISNIKKLEDRANKLQDKVMYRYFYEQRKCFALDFDDLLLVALHILRTNDEIRDRWQKRFEYILIDEYQDLDKDEYALSEILCGYHKNLFVVGDPDQTIYTFRGADVKFMIEFEENHPGTKVIMLNRNYRSTPEIIRATNELISHNRERIDKELVSQKTSGPLPCFFHAKTSEEEANFVAQTILERKALGKDLSNIAVLYRTHRVSRTIEEALMKAQVPYMLYSGVAFYARKEIKDVLCYMRMVISPDDRSFLRTVNEPRRGIGKKRMAVLEEYAKNHNCTLYEALLDNCDNDYFKGTGAKNYCSVIEKYRVCRRAMKISDLLTQLLAESGYEEALRLSGEGDRLDNLSELKQSVFNFEKDLGEESSLEDYLSAAALFCDVDRDEKRDCVKLMTVHCAKGLEFSTVFVCSLTEGCFPSKKTLTREETEEERRLAYVAMTRAEDELFLLDSEGKNYEGGNRYPSRFIFECGKEGENVHYANPLPDELMKAAAAELNCYPDQDDNLPKSRFTIGERILHPVFGSGTVLIADAKAHTVTVQFDSIPTPRSLSEDANIEKV